MLEEVGLVRLWWEYVVESVVLSLRVKSNPVRSGRISHLYSCLR